MEKEGNHPRRTGWDTSSWFVLTLLIKKTRAETALKVLPINLLGLATCRIARQVIDNIKRYRKQAQNKPYSHMAWSIFFSRAIWNKFMPANRRADL